MTSSFPPNVGNKRFLVSKVTTFMTATDGTGDTNLTYPFNQYSAEINFSGVPTTTNTMVVGSVTYRFIATPAQANDIDVAGTADAQANITRQALIDGNLLHSEDTSGAGTYHADTVINPDILHAEIGIAANIVHITSSSPITITTSSADNTDGQTLDGTTIHEGAALTTTVSYGGGDFTEIKANSAEAGANATTIIGVGGFSAAAAIPADTGISIYNHAGAFEGGGNLANATADFELMPMNIPGGPAANLQVATDDTALMVYYHRTS